MKRRFPFLVCPLATPMARRGPQYDLLQLLLRGGDQRLDEASEERLEQLYQEVAPQVRHRPRVCCPDPALRASPTI